MKSLHDTLCQELIAEGEDVESWQIIENDSLEYASDEDVIDLGYIDPADGTFKRPWCAATRILEHRENEKVERYRSYEIQGLASAATGPEILATSPTALCREQEAQRARHQGGHGRENKQRPRMTELPSVTEISKLTQRNEGEWDFTLDVSEDGSSIELEVAISRHVDTALVQVTTRLRMH